jgi:hypothetical protein
MKIKTTFVMFIVMAALISAAASNASAAKKFRFNASDTFIFDPMNIGGGFAEWLDAIGEGDSPNCRTNFGLLLQKSAPTEANQAVGTELQGLAGAVVTDDDTLGYDIRNDSPCLNGSPRFNVHYTLPDGTEGFSFVGGCANGTITMSPQNPSWKRVTFDLQDQAFPAIPVGSVINSVELIVDDQGSFMVDNIQFRDLYFDKPGSNPGNAPRCTF